MSDESVVSASRVINATPDAIFAILADATRHADIDGSGLLRHHRGEPQPLTLGARFGMDMKMGLLPYRMGNTVVEFEPDRLIAWRPGGPQRWRYELEPVAGGTRVTETFDWSQFPALGRRVLEAVGLPARNLAAMRTTLQRLADLVESDAAS
ncbi:MAG: SRPBCC family protein [Propioniciclava sp.]